VVPGRAQRPQDAHSVHILAMVAAFRGTRSSLGVPARKRLLLKLACNRAVLPAVV
jgi:hypothetical protein